MKRKSTVEKCSVYDYSLTASARNALKVGFKFICICVHCRGQAKTEADIQHTKECCFYGSNKDK